MKPVTFTTERLTLDALTEADVDVMTSYCQDTVLKDAVPIPWPYDREHADGFINELAPQWWAEGSEFTGAIRRTATRCCSVLSDLTLRVPRLATGWGPLTAAMASCPKLSLLSLTGFNRQAARSCIGRRSWATSLRRAWLRRSGSNTPARRLRWGDSATTLARCAGTLAGVTAAVQGLLKQ